VGETKKAFGERSALPSAEERERWRDLPAPIRFPRDEVVRAIERRGDCRIPQFCHPIPVFFRNTALYDFFALWPNDAAYVTWGLDARRMVARNGAPLLIHGTSAIPHALKDWAELDAICDWLLAPPTEEWKAAMRSCVEAAPDAYRVAIHSSVLFETAYLLRGMERFFLDLSEYPRQVERLLDRVLGYTCALVPHYAEAGLDCLFLSDDWGSQQSLLINPDLWRAIFKPRYREIVRACHSCGLHVLFHSDGNLDTILPDLVETGIDICHPLQPGAIDVERWLREYKGAICFYSGIDVQGVLPFASPREVKDSVRRAVDRFRDDRGGFILGPTNGVTAEVPYENLVALYETLLEYR
jgi:hypothetical protein